MGREDERGEDGEFDGLELNDDFVRGATFKEGDARSRGRDARTARNEARRAARPASHGGLRQFANRRAATVIVVVGLFGAWIWLRDEPPRTVPVTLPSTVVAAGPSTTTDTYELGFRSYTVGECVTWDDSQMAAPDPRTTPSVGCDTPHILEVTETVEISARTADFPTDDGWAAIYAQACTASTVRVLGGPLDPQGRFYIGGIQPTRESWASGDRRLVCGVHAQSNVPLPRGRFLRFTGKVAGQDQTRLYGTGACLSDQTAGPAVVDCAASHDYEITGSVDLAGRTDALPASIDEWNRLMGSDCTALAGGRGSGWFPISPESWAAGRRVAECMVFTD